jgi:hypothetical protein
MDNYHDPSISLVGCRVELISKGPFVITLSITLTEFV